MSVMIVKNETVQRTAKVVMAYTENKYEEQFPLNVVNQLVQNIAYLNCQSFADRYNEDVEVEYDLFDELPDSKLSPQDVVSACCWSYQIEGYDDDVTYKLVNDAISWAKKEINFTDSMYDDCIWG